MNIGIGLNLIFGRLPQSGGVPLPPITDDPADFLTVADIYGRYALHDFSDGNGVVYSTADNAGRIRFQFQGTSLQLNMAASTTSEIEYSIDGGFWNRIESTGDVDLATGLTDTNHTCDIFVAGVYFIDRWDGDKGPRIIGITLDAEKLIGVYPTNNATNVLIIGDSITSEAVYDSGINAKGSEGRRCWSQVIAEVNGWNVWNTGHGGTGITVAQGTTPDALGAYPFVYSGEAKDDPTFDKIFIHQGHNENGVASATFKADYTTLINTLKVDHPAADIYCMTPIGNWAPNRILDVQEVAASTSTNLIDSHLWDVSTEFNSHPDLQGQWDMADNLAIDAAFTRPDALPGSAVLEFFDDYTNTQGFTVSASSEFSIGFAAFIAVNGMEDDQGWAGLIGDVVGSWWEIDFNQTITLDTLRLQSTNLEPDRMFKDFHVEGWNGSSWVLVGTFVNVTDWADEIPKEFALNGGSYSKARITCDAFNGDPANLVSIGTVDFKTFSPLPSSVITSPFVTFTNAQGFTVSATSNFGNPHYAWRAVDGVTDDAKGWVAAEGEIVGSEWEIDFGVDFQIIGINLMSILNVPTWMLKDFRVQIWTGSAWETIGTFTNQTMWVNETWYGFLLTETVGSKMKIICDANNGDVTYLGIGEIQFIGIEQ